MNKTTKYCPKCKNANLLLLSSHNKKICTDCRIEIPWFLTEGQKPLY